MKSNARVTRRQTAKRVDVLLNNQLGRELKSCSFKAQLTEMAGGCSERIDMHSFVPMIKNSFTLSLLPEMKFSRWFSSSLQPPLRTSNTQPFSKLQCCQNSVRSDSSKTRKPWTHSNRTHAFHCFENTETFSPSAFQFTPTISVDLSDERPVSIAIIAGLDAVCMRGLTFG